MARNGFGIHKPSPIKKRDKYKARKVVILPGQAQKRAALASEIAALLSGAPSFRNAPAPIPADIPPEPEPVLQTQPVAEEIPGLLEVDDSDDEWEDTDPNSPTNRAKAIKAAKLHAKRVRNNTRWQDALPTLVAPFLEHLQQSYGKPATAPTNVSTGCQKPGCTRKTQRILCLFLDHFSEKDVVYCGCRSLPQVLVRHGLFPAAPVRPRIAVANTILNLYKALFERSCDAVHAIASALNMTYERNGYILLNEKLCRAITLPPNSSA
ncbi:hypothetical protein C8J56DRAFT_1056767 [Mycena floridula]|nr:hypothetical protein C8J56DRAFT_1056767 [Mycena floridula]